MSDRTSYDKYKPGGKRISRYPAYPMDTVTTYWEDVKVPGTQVQPTGERPPTLAMFRKHPTKYGVWAYSFATNEVEDLNFSVQIPHAWKEGTTIYPHVHWTPSTPAASGTGNVLWGLEYVWADVFDVFPEDASWKTTLASTVNPNTGVMADRDHLVTSFHDNYGAGEYGFNAEGKKISSMLMCRLVRWASHQNDTYNSGAFFLEFDVHFEVNSPGSIRPFNKVGDRSRTGRFRL